MLSSILIFLVILSILILVHELGHFIMARRAGVWVEEFGFGLPPRVFGKKIGETIYSINLLPFGGFVRLHGESDEAEKGDPKRAFINKSKKARIGIVVAGVIMNFILAIVAFATVYSFSGIPQDTGEVKIADVTSGSPAHTSGLLVGDIVRRVGETEVASVTEFIGEVEERKGERIVLEIEREIGDEKETIQAAVTPREDPPEGEGPLGVIISSIEIYYPPVWQRPFVGVYYGFQEALFWGQAVVLGIGKIFSDLFTGQPVKDLAGPVGIFAITSEAASFGILALINFVGILSVNLAILNIIPFPALDGGRLAFIGIETVFGRKVLPRIEAATHTIGMIILLLLIFAITAKDIRRLIDAGSLSGFLDSLLR